MMALSHANMMTRTKSRTADQVRPEWYSRAEAPTKQAANAGAVGAGSSADCPDPDTVFVR